MPVESSLSAAVSPGLSSDFADVSSNARCTSVIPQALQQQLATASDADGSSHCLNAIAPLAKDAAGCGMKHASAPALSAM